MKWTDINTLAEELVDTYPEIDPTKINFVDLMNWIKLLPNFYDARQCNEKILEAVQQAWIDEKS